MSGRMIITIFLMFLFISSISVAKDAKEGLLAYLSFDEGTGKVAKDISDRGNDGQINNAEWVNGKYGKALSFNGTDAFVEIPYNDDFNITDGLTLAAWIKIDHLPLDPPYRGIINAKKTNYGPYLLQTSVLNGLSVYEFSIYIKANWTWNVSKAEETTDWVHLAGTYDGSDSKIYINGKLDVTKQMGGKIDENTEEGVTIGHFYGLAGRWFHGIIDEVAIYNRAISEDEVNNLFAGALDLKAVDPAFKTAAVWGGLKAAK